MEINSSHLNKTVNKINSSFIDKNQINHVHSTHVKQLINELIQKANTIKSGGFFNGNQLTQRTSIVTNKNSNENKHFGNSGYLDDFSNNNSLDHEHAQLIKKENTSKNTINLVETSLTTRKKSDLTSSTQTKSKYKIINKNYPTIVQEQQQTVVDSNQLHKEQQYLPTKSNSLPRINVQNLNQSNNFESASNCESNYTINRINLDRAVDSLIINNLVDPNDLPNTGITVGNETTQNITLTTESYLNTKINSSQAISDNSNLSSYVSSVSNSFKSENLEQNLLKPPSNKQKPSSKKCLNCDLKRNIQYKLNLNMSNNLLTKEPTIENGDYLKQLDVQQLNQLIMNNAFTPSNLIDNTNVRYNSNILNSKCELLENENSEQVKRFLCRKCRPNKLNNLNLSNKQLKSMQLIQNSKNGWNIIKECSKGSIKRLKRHQERLRGYTRAMRKHHHENANTKTSVKTNSAELNENTTQTVLAKMILNEMVTNNDTNKDKNNFCRECYIEHYLANRHQTTSLPNNISISQPTVCLGCCDHLNGVINTLIVKNANNLKTNLSNKLPFKSKLNENLFEKSVDRYWDVEQWRNKLRKERLRKKERNILMVVSSVAIIIFIGISYFGTILFLRLTKMQNEE